MTDTKRWGAYPEEWDHLAFVCGVLPDMLPYIADPSVLPSENTKWRPASKMPGAVGRNGLGHGIKGWREKTTTAGDIERFAAEPAHGICIVTRNLRAIDVDIYDKDEADEVERIILQHFGKIPTRRRKNSTKFLCPVWIPGEFAKRKVRTSTMDPTGRYHSAVEILADGQQFFAVGTHESGARYEWEGGLPLDFPTITLDQLDAFMADVRLFVGDDDVEVSNLPTSLAKPRSADDIKQGDFVAEHLRDNAWVKEIDRRTGTYFIICPFESGHSKADTDNSATAYFPAGVGGMEQGHFKCLHASCAGRTDADFIQAIGAVAAQFDVVEVPEGEIEAPAFQRNDKGKILSTIGNAMLALRAPEWYGYDIAYDTFIDRLMFTRFGRDEWRPFTDSDYTRMRVRLEAMGMPISLELMKEAVKFHGSQNSFDSAQLWLEEIVPEWDGVERIDHFYPRYWGTTDTPYTRAVGAYTWTALAGRVLDPGHKVDMVPVLTSGEGCNKTSALRCMVPFEGSCFTMDVGEGSNADLARLMVGKLIAELGELKGLNKKDMGWLKSFVTNEVEVWIPKYCEHEKTYPRRLLLIGTTNEHRFMSEHTGARRWLPMAITRADREAITRDRLQLWAEGRERFKATGLAYQQAEELARLEHDSFTEVDPWHGVIARWLDDVGIDGVRNGDGYLETGTIAVSALGLSQASAGFRQATKPISSVMRALGYELTQKRVDGKRPWLWVRTQKNASS